MDLRPLARLDLDGLRDGPRGSRLLRLPLGQLHAEVGLDEAVELAVEHRAGVADLVAGPQVLDELVRLQDVGADLAAEADLALLVVDLGEFGLALLLLQADQLGLEQGQGSWRRSCAASARSATRRRRRSGGGCSARPTRSCSGAGRRGRRSGRRRASARRRGARCRSCRRSRAGRRPRRTRSAAVRRSRTG